LGIRITIAGLEKVYRKGPETVHVLRGVDLELAPGAAVAVTGVSGAGKSTLLHILGTLDRPTGGTVRFDGEDVFARNDRDLAAFRNRHVGFVFQFHHLLEDFDARENVAFPLLLRGASRRAALAEAGRALERVGLGPRLTHRPAELSGGEQQRVAIARALVGRPSLLLMDEPSGNLDSGTADDIHELIENTAREAGATLVVVTHNAELAARLPQHLDMHGGRLAAA
jgi:lipoprotein-releasing system ATP-binding protein